MRIGLISDTHDRLPAIDAALELFRQRGIDTLLHPGDVIAPFAARRLARFAGTLHVVYGNNDGERDGLKAALPQIMDGPQILELGGKKILLHHYIDWCGKEDLDDVDIVVTGHTHEFSVQQRDGLLLVNPGECCGWVTGHCTVAVLDTVTGQVERIEILQ